MMTHRYIFVEESKEEYTESIIEIPSSDRRDAALFTCLATNLYGKDSKNIQLLVQGAYTYNPISKT